VVSEPGVSNAEVGSPLLGRMDNPVEGMLGDGSYDRREVHAEAHRRGPEQRSRHGVTPRSSGMATRRVAGQQATRIFIASGDRLGGVEGGIGGITSGRWPRRRFSGRRRSSERGRPAGRTFSGRPRWGSAARRRTSPRTKGCQTPSRQRREPDGVWGNLGPSYLRAAKPCKTPRKT